MILTQLFLKVEKMSDKNAFEIWCEYTNNFHDNSNWASEFSKLADANVNLEHFYNRVIMISINHSMLLAEFRQLMQFVNQILLNRKDVSIESLIIDGLDKIAEINKSCYKYMQYIPIVISDLENTSVMTSRLLQDVTLLKENIISFIRSLQNKTSYDVAVKSFYNNFSYFLKK
jgi:hypothetical protein